MNKTDKKKILIAADSREDSRLLSEILQTGGYICSFSGNSDGMLLPTGGKPPDLILLGSISGKSPVEALKMLRSDNRCGDIPVIIIREKESSDNDKIFSSGASDYISKPLSEDEVIFKTGSQLHKKNILADLDFHRTLVQASPAFIVVIDKEGRTLMMNPAMLSALGYSVDEVTGMDYLSTFVPERNRDELSDIFQKIISNGDVTINENLLLRKDRKEILVEWHGRPVYDYSGRLQFFFGIGIDITIRKRIENELRESEDKYRTLFEQSKDAMLIIDKNVFIDCNIAALQMLGYKSKNELLNSHPSEISPPRQPDGRSSFEKAEEVLAGVKRGENQRFEWMHIRANGEHFWVEVTLTLIPYMGREVVHTCLRDITEKKRSDEALVASEKLLRSVANNIPGVVYQFYVHKDGAMGLYYVSERSEEILGIRNDCDNFFKRFTESVVEEDRTRFLNSIQVAVDKFEKWDFEMGFLKPSGERIWLKGISEPVKSVDQIIFNGVLLDITEQKRTESQLQQAQKLETVGTLAGGLAHDFNNILSGIMGPLSMINFKLEKDTDIDRNTLSRYTGMMYDSSKRAVEIIQQLLSLSRKKELSLNPLDLNISIRNVMNICENSFDKSIEIKLSYSDLPANALADQTQIEQVLLNLCVNGAHSMTIMREDRNRWGGILAVTIEKASADDAFLRYQPETEHGDYWCISVHDSGVGISKENIAKIFDPFYTTKGNVKGTGLGLSIVYSIIRAHHGFINVNSEPGKGSSFNIYIPVLHETDIQKHKSGIKAQIFHGEGTVLVADDEVNVRTIMKMFLEECGYDVLLAENGKECVDVFKKNQSIIKAVILDMSMPVMSGRDTYIKIKEIDPGVRVLLSSGFRQDNRVNEVLSLGVQGFIQKPVTLEKLSEEIYRIIYRT